MNKPETKHRRKLNDEQLEVLELLYKFRFGSNNLIAEYFGKKDRSFVFKRLTILLEQGLIGKRFDSSYRIQGKPAAYYLTPTGARILQQEHREPVNITAIYKDKNVSEQFIRHNLDIFSIYNQLKAKYGSKLKFFTKVDLNYEQFDYFPQPLPDAYIRLKGKEEQQFLLDVFHDHQPFFKAVRKVKQYITYAEEGDWAITETEFPIILVICDSPTLQKRLQKQITKALNTTYEEVVFATTTKDEIKNLSQNDGIWQPANEPEEQLSLPDIQ